MKAWLALLLIVPAIANAQDAKRRDSYVQREVDLAVTQPGPHDGGGSTTAFPFFENADGFDIVFRKRVLHPGSTIGEHVNDKDEIYYVVEGRGVLTLNGRTQPLSTGEAVLTRNGDSHALAPEGGKDLVIIVVYPKKATPAK